MGDLRTLAINDKRTIRIEDKLTSSANLVLGDGQGHTWRGPATRGNAWESGVAASGSHKASTHAKGKPPKPVHLLADRANKHGLTRKEPGWFVIFKGKWCNWTPAPNAPFGWGEKKPEPTGIGIGLYGKFRSHHGVERLVSRVASNQWARAGHERELATTFPKPYQAYHSKRQALEDIERFRRLYRIPPNRMLGGMGGPRNGGRGGGDLGVDIPVKDFLVLAAEAKRATEREWEDGRGLGADEVRDRVVTAGDRDRAIPDGSIERERGTAGRTVDGDGDAAAAAAAAASGSGFGVGDRVEASCMGSLKKYPGRVAAKNRDGTYDVKFDAVAREARCAAAARHPREKTWKREEEAERRRPREALREKFGSEGIRMGAQLAHDRGGASGDTGRSRRYAPFKKEMEEEKRFRREELQDRFGKVGVQQGAVRAAKFAAGTNDASVQATHEQEVLAELSWRRDQVELADAGLVEERGRYEKAIDEHADDPSKHRLQFGSAGNATRLPGAQMPSRNPEKRSASEYFRVKCDRRSGVRQLDSTSAVRHQRGKHQPTPFQTPAAGKMQAWSGAKTLPQAHNAGAMSHGISRGMRAARYSQPPVNPNPFRPKLEEANLDADGGSAKPEDGTGSKDYVCDNCYAYLKDGGVHDDWCDLA